MRKAGVLMPVLSLPSKYGIGDFGPEAYKFIDILAQMQIKIWQVLPLNPLGYGNSPYQAYSSFAGDELYISLDQLITDGLLATKDIRSLNSKATTINYLKVREHKQQILKNAFANFKSSHKLLNQYNEFVTQTSWLTNYAVFLTLKKVNQLKLWASWPKEQKNWIKDKKFDLGPYHEQIEYEMFLQFIFHHQWFQLKKYANNCGIEIMGDMPIYVGFDSLDVWENQTMFLLDKNQRPTFIAGVPPDSFSKTGQRWGNPIYNWEALAADKFKLWITRLRNNAKAFDMIRIDHFRAFDTYWKVPVSCNTAIDGEWVEAPGYELFDTIFQELPGINIIAEDLGDLREEVLVLRDHYNLKGMKVFSEVFRPQADNSELEAVVNTIIYTGTHDNHTLMGWYNQLKAQDKKQLKTYFKISKDKDIKNAVLKYILYCKAEYVIFPIQDILGMDDSARINFPGKSGSPNWEWKLSSLSQLRQKIKFMARHILLSER